MFHQLQYTRSKYSYYQYFYTWCLAVGRMCVEAASVPARLHRGILWPTRSYQERKKRRQTWKRDNTEYWKKEYLILAVCLHTDKPSSPSTCCWACVLTVQTKPPCTKTGNNKTNPPPNTHTFSISHFVVFVVTVIMCAYITSLSLSPRLCVTVWLHHCVCERFISGGTSVIVC